MTVEVFYAPEASDDIDRAFEWFAARAPAVAADFVRAIGQAEIVPIALAVHAHDRCS
jgi:plasmid stabilization system protein ParE